MKTLKIKTNSETFLLRRNHALASESICSEGQGRIQPLTTPHGVLLSPVMTLTTGRQPSGFEAA